MKVDFVVHGVRRGHVARDADMDGAKQRVLVDGVEVELTEVNTGRSFTLSRYGADADKAEKLFRSGGKVTATFTATKDSD